MVHLLRENDKGEGTWVVWQGQVTVAVTARLGPVVDIAWTALPRPAGYGACLAAATQDGGIAFLDVSQSMSAAPRRARSALPPLPFPPRNFSRVHPPRLSFRPALSCIPATISARWL